MSEKPGGNSTASSPCDIQTSRDFGNPPKSSDSATISTSACPYSRVLAGFTFPRAREPSIAIRNKSPERALRVQKRAGPCWERRHRRRNTGLRKERSQPESGCGSHLGKWYMAGQRKKHSVRGCGAR